MSHGTLANVSRTAPLKVSQSTFMNAYTTDGGDQTLNNYDCQNLRQVFTGVPVHFKHAFSGVPKISKRGSLE